MRRTLVLIAGVLLASLAALGAVAFVARLQPAGRTSSPAPEDQPADRPAVAAPDAGLRDDSGPEVTAAGPSPTDPHPLPEILIDPSVTIEKSARRLTVFSDGEPVKRYRIALGGDPLGHKRREGDMRTPEGEYYVCSKNPESRFHLSLGLSYPNEADADAALEVGLISKREHKAIVSAVRKMQRPPWNTALGGEIMIHGAGSGRGDWTLGCAALDNADIEELFTALPLGTEVRILP